MAYLGPQAGVRGDRERVEEAPLLQVVGGVVGLVAAGEVRPDAGDAGAARAFVLGGPGDQVRPVVERRPAAGQAGVDLELDAWGSDASPAATTWSRRSTVYAVMSTSASIARVSDPSSTSAGRVSQQRIRPVSPASRRASASGTVATPSQVAPPSRAARPTSTMPWP